MAADPPDRPKFMQVPTAITAVVPPPARDAIEFPGLGDTPLIAAVRDESWSVKAGVNLTAAAPELAELMKECSGLSWSRGQLVAAHSQADFVEFIDPGTMVHRRVELPKGGARQAAGLRAGADLQVECVMAARDWRGEFLLAFGSGTGGEFQRVVRMRVGAGELDLAVVEAKRLYRGLSELPGFATSTLNVEGVAWIRPTGAPAMVRMCQRGNGKPRGGATPQSATVDIRQDVLLAYLERAKGKSDAQLGDDLVNVRRYDLGNVEGTPYSFSDASGLEGGRMLFVAAAERCVDAGMPGRNFGTALGIVAADGSARYAPICEADGTPSLAKVAALTVDDQGNIYAGLQAVGREPPRLCRLEISGMPLKA